jgi:hypothetical protein
VRGAIAGVLLTRVGHLLPLPGLPTHPLSGAGSAPPAAAARQRHSNPLPYVPTELRPTAGRVRVTVLAWDAHPRTT